MAEKLLKKPTLQFNIRSFHPEKDFGWSGLKFKGDNRGFSLKPSGTGIVTSRIWHRFGLNLAESKILNVTTRSDPSMAPWADKYQTYEGELAPKGVVSPVMERDVKGNISTYRLNGKYGGVNHAMPGSPEMQKKTGGSYVPTLDVSYRLLLDLDRDNMHVDIVIYVTGDGFPNCEAFVVDGSGKAVFLGVHVRKGAAPITLALNLDYPMIAVAVRIPLDMNGNFKDTIGDEWERVKGKQLTMKYYKIENWNQKFLALNPNNRHCMLLEKASLEGCFN